ncbi:hypothetical protein [Streptomyces cucumeris]|uniref:hypothetical protein n=1 Tax=Streptomyces cucumeris TaxID=2962890 RepID=UPI0020C8463F|nr:hypothetical protein [Streptomyces sp. NEAU-Y11]MCP9211513.1 hypothetical protein [Streptomyces sp. NEAU-Y11]
MTAARPTAPCAEEAWCAAILHAAGCLACRTSGAVCERGEALLAAYAEAVQQGRSSFWCPPWNC